MWEFGRSPEWTGWVNPGTGLRWIKAGHKHPVYMALVCPSRMMMMKLPILGPIVR